MSIHSEAMLVSIKISQWSARKFDKAASISTAHSYGATEAAGRYNKQLIPKENLREVSQAANAIKSYLYKVTVPWSDVSNQHLLSSSQYFEFAAETKKLIADFDTAAEEFTRKYGTLVQDAALALNGLYKSDDYPDPADIQEKFRVEIDVSPVPKGDHLFLDIEKHSLEGLQKKVDEKVDEKVVEVQRRVWERLYAVVENMANRLGDTDAIFRDTLVGNIEDLCKILPGLNVAGDAELSKMIAEVEDKLAAHDPQTLRDDDLIREDTATAAAEILDRMKGFM